MYILSYGLLLTHTGEGVHACELLHVKFTEILNNAL